MHNRSEYFSENVKVVKIINTNLYLFNNNNFFGNLSFVFKNSVKVDLISVEKIVIALMSEYYMNL